jgi:probable rRNA maturation factor
VTVTANEPKVDLQLTCAAPALPDSRHLSAWLALACDAIGRDRCIEVSIRIVDEEESRRLNREFRSKDRPTNVLSFPSGLENLAGLPADDARFLGDLVICAPVVAEEAAAQGKAAQAHWQHLVLHGFLHLNGYDHETDEQAHLMEGIETRLMVAQGLPDPYNDPISN